MSAPPALPRPLADLGHALLPAFVAVVYVPAVIYDSNPGHFASSFLLLLPRLLLLAAIAAVLGGALAAWAPPQPRAWGRAWFLGTFLWCAVAASLFQEHLALDGEGPVTDTLSSEERWITGAFILALWAGLIAAAKRWTELLTRFSGFLALAMLGMVVYVSASSWNGRPGTSAPLPSAYSRDRNVIVVVLDKLQGGVVGDLLTAEPEIALELPGFVWYTRAKAGSRSTYLSLPIIHAGREYDGTEPLGEWFRKSIEEDSFVNTFADAGFATTVVYPLPELATCPTRAGACIDSATVGPVVQDRAATESEILLRFAAFRLAPPPVKPYVAPGGDGMEPEADSGPRAATGLAAAVLQGNVVLDTLASAVTADSERPTLRFVHLLSTHSPVVVDAKCAYKPAGWNRPNAAKQARCAFAKLATWFRALDAAGVYDNSTILVLSDHGAGFVAPGANQAVGFAESFLMVKPPSARGPLSESAKAPALRDIGATACGLSGACEAKFGHDVASRDFVAEPTTFFSYDRATSDPRMGAVPEDEVFELGERPEDFRTWKRVSGAVPCDGTASFNAQVRGLSTFGVGWGDYADLGKRRVRLARSDVSELWVCMGDGAPTRLEIEAMSAGKTPRLVDVRLDGAELGVLELPVGKPASMMLTLPQGLVQPAGVHLVTFKPRSASVPSRYTVWGKVAAVALR